MNKIFNIFATLLVLAVLLPSCDKEDLFPCGDSDGKTGTVNFRKMVVEVNSGENEVRAADVNVGEFLVEVTSASGSTEYAGTYAEMPEVLTLPVGGYTVTAKSPSNPDAAWETPYYEGKQTFTVKENEVTFVDPVVCKIANVKVTVKYDSRLLAVMDDDCVVTVQTGAGSTLQYSKTETRSGNFRYVEGEGTATLVATFRGTVEENYEENFRTYTDVAPGNHYIITYRLKTPGGEEPDVTGTINPGVNVDAVVEVVDMNLNIDVEDDILDETDRPQQGEDKPDKPDNPDPEKKAPAISATINGNTVDFDKTQDVADQMTVLVNITSEAQGGFTDLTIDINSTTLTSDILSGVGIGTNLDLVNPGSMKLALESLNLPTGSDVKGKTSLSIDISQFVPLLGIYGAGDHKFVVTVTDANGTTVRTLHFVTK